MNILQRMFWTIIIAACGGIAIGLISNSIVGGYIAFSIIIAGGYFKECCID